jgi:hypothetical protein
MQGAPVARHRHPALQTSDILPDPALHGGDLAGVVDADGRVGVELRFRSFGVRVGVWLDPAVLEHADPADLMAPLPPGWRPAGPGPVDVAFRVVHQDRATSPIGTDGFHLYEDGAFVALGAVVNRMEHLLAVLEGRVHAGVAARAPRHLFLHAGVVGWRGRAIVLPGASFSGKSTLVAALVDAGATYLSDEFAVIDGTGAVHPFPRRLSTRSAASGTARRVDLGDRASLGPPEAVAMPIGVVALARYRRGAAWSATALDEPSAMLALCEHALSMDRNPGWCLEIIQRMASTIPVVRATRGEAAEAAARLLHDIPRLDASDPQPVDAGSAA